MAFRKGEKVMVVRYGHLYWKMIDGAVYSIDMDPGIIGKTGIVTRMETVNGRNIYSVDGIPEKKEWYDERQLQQVPDPISNIDSEQQDNA